MTLFGNSKTSSNKNDAISFDFDNDIASQIFSSDGNTHTLVFTVSVDHGDKLAGKANQFNSQITLNNIMNSVLSEIQNKDHDITWVNVTPDRDTPSPVYVYNVLIQYK